ncbi:MAG TPA: ABC transporter permease [Actinomycetota bacterium]|nr:ABC transporter permease [Actinomycetota bacterium]
MAGTVQVFERSSQSPRLHVGERLRVLAAHREILMNLIRKELKVRYAASVLGAIWSLLNPLVYLAVFSFVARVLGAGIPDYPVYLLSGLLAWNLFSASMSSGARSVLENANLVKKVAFPHEILPLSAVGVALVDFALQSVVLLLFIVVSGYGIHLPELALWPLAFVTLLVLTVGLSLWFSALNVRYRDVGHLLTIGLLVWFWATPIVYAGYQVQDLAASGSRAILGVPMFWLYLLNPLVAVVAGFQRALYGAVHPPRAPEPVLFTYGLGWYALLLVGVLVVAIVVVLLAWRYFFTRSGDFAEEL